MKYATIGLIALLSLTTACTTTASLSSQMDDWQGQNIGAAIAVWGQPDAEQAFRGQAVSIWRDHESQLLPTGAMYDWTTAAIVCERMLAVSDDGTITGWRWRGASCPSLHATTGQTAVSHSVR